MNSREQVAMVFLCVLCIFIGLGSSIYVQKFFMPPTMKIWDSNKMNDNVLRTDNSILCNPLNQSKALYYRYETVIFNKTEYIALREQTSSFAVRDILVCSDNYGQT